MDLLPRGVLVVFFPNGVSRLQDGPWSGGADHEGVGFLVEGVELGGDVGLRVDDVELGLRCLVGLVVRVGVGFGRVEEGGRGRFLGGKRKTGRWVSGLVIDLSSTIFLFLIFFL